MMMWERTITVEGQQPKTECGQMNPDEYQQIKGDECAQIEAHVGTQYNFGEAKVDFTVRLTCNQDAATIYKAGELAFQTAKRMVDAGLSMIYPPEPQLPPPQVPAGPTYGAPR